MAILKPGTEAFERLARMIADMLFLAKAENGLAITQAILHAHRGEVSATSAQGLTVFTLRLPS
ncbi:hypothetical protein [Simplicispira lacusdiani]|uniref:hypothetical protein n=1 Tax=Simplicispira lacusdiani TaxID=2213010 RepID=UPI00130053F7|nr:hypothetical protein [Simplicispira lacusdiani]